MISSQDLFIIGVLVFLEGILSIDNALVLAMMARHLPKHLQRKALTYGLFGAVGFRLASLFIVTQLMQWAWVKYLGGGYLVFIAIRHLFFSKKEESENESSKASGRSFWMTVLMIELLDIAFAVDSILAAVALTPKFWLVFTGGFLGVILMRFAASYFLVLLEKFPRFETTAYLLILVIGTKLVIEAMHLPGVDFHSTSSAPFWIFWGLMAACFFSGFRRASKSTEK